MTTINPLSTLLGKAFDKLDRDKDGNLNRSEFNLLYEVLKPGVPHDEDNKPLVTSSDYFRRMDANNDGVVKKSEVLTCGVLLPAELSSDGSLEAMLKYLQEQTSETAAQAAALLQAEEEPKKPA
ncbi:hypothetical protein [Noviherbaspirillum sp.]|uniref:hypothetical protein n=1 Tax=Noviherbaspirillum sp. TaxID=1926288 RepID=UPI002D6236D4|nr:hypothetical protein [Noviherbaspirillum sp.]HZW20858.1 hypothetical protein [Noviherbaspirillum sp.]